MRCNKEKRLRKGWFTVMDKSSKVVDFYMGANAPNGFNTYYGELENPVEGWRSYLIKGGAGTGKSSLMKRVLLECDSNEGIVERIHCSSDPNSLDGVIIYDKRISMVDATPPHVIEPAYPGGYQTVINLCEYFDEYTLTCRLNETVRLQTSNGSCHEKCRNLLNCANILLNENSSYINKVTDFDKISTFVKRIIKKELKSCSKLNNKAIEHKRLLSAVTNQGVKTFTDTPKKLAKKIYLIKDEYGVSSNAILTQLRIDALTKGYEIYSCYCPLNQRDKLEHLFIPELSLGFVTANKYNDFSSISPLGVVSYTRFTELQAVRRKKQYIGFNKKIAKELINEATATLVLAKQIHDELELQYTNAVDFSRVNIKTKEIIDKINER